MWEKHEEERFEKIERKARSGNTLGIIGTIAGGLALAGGNVLGGFLGGGRFEQSEINRLAGKESNDYIELTKAWYEGQIANLKDLYAIRQNDVAEKFGLYQNDNNNAKVLQAQIDELKTKIAVGEAVRPYQDKILMDAIAREAQERCCADQRIICYDNQTFAPLYTASQEPGATTVTYTQKPVYNPFCCSPCGVQVAMM